MKKINTTRFKQDLLNKMCVTERERFSFLEEARGEDLSIYAPVSEFEVRMTLRDQQSSNYFSKTR